jgi:hypothetical protein
MQTKYLKDEIVRGDASKLINIGFRTVTSLDDYSCQIQLVNPSDAGSPLVNRAVTDFNNPSPSNNRFIFRLSATELNTLPEGDDERKILARVTRTDNNPVSEPQVQTLEIIFKYVEGEFV